jgi:hypothetical protein
VPAIRSARGSDVAKVLENSGMEIRLALSDRLRAAIENKDSHGS